MGAVKEARYNSVVPVRVMVESPNAGGTRLRGLGMRPVSIEYHLPLEQGPKVVRVLPKPL